MSAHTMKFRYPIGYPFWKLAAVIGIPLTIRVDVHIDQESQTYWANSPGVDGLIVSGATLDELKSEFTNAAALILLGEAIHTRRPLEADIHMSTVLGAA